MSDTVDVVEPDEDDDGPQACSAIVYSGRMSGPDPEPPEFCDEEAVPGKTLCPAHLGDVEAVEYDPP